MKVDLDLLRRLWPRATFQGFVGNEIFTCFDIVDIGLGDRPDTLFFAAFVENVNEDGWYPKPFDRHSRMHKKRGIPCVVQSDRYLGGAGKVIVVPDIMMAIEALYKFCLSRVQPKVFGVTGSVGKTTTIALAEAVLSEEYEAARIYSMRITPLVLMAKMINEIGRNVEWIVMEYSMYYRHHIPELTRLLPPTVAGFLNVRPIHIGVDGITNENDIAHRKAVVFDRGAVPITNIDDPFVASQKIDNPITFSFNKRESDVCVEKMESRVFIRAKKHAYQFEPFLRTRLFIEQALMVCALADWVGMDEKRVGRAISEFIPEENRLMKQTIGGRPVLLDAARETVPSHLAELANNFYPLSYLVIERIEFESKLPDSVMVRELASIFRLFRVVRINIEERQLFEEIGVPGNSHFVKPGFLLKDIPEQAFVVYHSACKFVA